MCFFHCFHFPCVCIANTVPHLAFGHPRAPKLLPRSSQGAPKSSQGAPKSSQDRPSYALVIRNSAPRFPRRTQGGLKEHQRVPDELPRVPNELPRTSLPQRSQKPSHDKLQIKAMNFDFRKRPLDLLCSNVKWGARSKSGGHQF